MADETDIKNIKEIGTIEDIKITEKELNGVRYIDIRKFFERDEQVLPTKKGIFIRKNLIEKMVNFLKEVKDDEEQNQSDWNEREGHKEAGIKEEVETEEIN